MVDLIPELWHYTISGARQEGPVVEEQLIDLVGKGVVRPTDLVWHESVGDKWVSVSSMRQFAVAIPENIAITLPPMANDDQKKALAELQKVAKKLAKTVKCLDEAEQCVEKCKQEINEAYCMYILDGVSITEEDFNARLKDFVAGMPEQGSKPRKASRSTPYAHVIAKKRITPMMKATAIRKVVEEDMTYKALALAVGSELEIPVRKIGPQFYTATVKGILYNMRVSSGYQEGTEGIVDHVKVKKVCEKVIKASS